MKPLQVKLIKPDWHHSTDTSCRGWCFDQHGVFRSGNALVELFSGINTRAGITDKVASLNGCFCVVTQRDGVVLAVVDRVRSQPLFYTKYSTDPILSDDARTAASALPAIKIANAPLVEFLLTGYVTGNDTLPEGLFQLNAGQVLVWMPGTSEPEIEDYFVYQHQDSDPEPEPRLEEQLEELHMDIARRLVESAAGRQVLIPLSGGLDSRLIARCLARLKAPDVLCFSYGNPRAREAKISKAVADTLSLPWIFVPHTREMWYQAYNSQIRKEFYQYADNLSASAHIQDWLAVRELRDHRLVSEDAVFVPGHSADFLQGSHLPSLFSSKQQFTQDEVADAIIARHYRLWNYNNVDPSLRETLKGRITAGIQSPVMDQETAAGTFETFDWRERQAKFIVNSVRVYEFFGYQWRLPLWDNALMDFWSRIPLRYRMGRALYLRYAKNHGDLDIPRYTHDSFTTRVRQRVIRSRSGFSYDIRYARFVDPGHKAEAIHRKVCGLCPKDLDLPGFVERDLPILRADINALQTLVMLKEWLR
jgi:asparagine synthase (glutamine-hydrolysing)